MAGEATRRGDFIPFGADTMGQDRELIRAAVQAFASGQLQPDQPFAQLAQQMDLPRQSAAPQQSPQPAARPSRSTAPTETPRPRTRLPDQAGNIEESRLASPRSRGVEAGTGRRRQLERGPSARRGPREQEQTLPEGAVSESLANARSERLQPFLDRLIQIESSGDPTAKNPRSSAGGLGQFTDSTWVETVRRNAPEVAEGRSKQELLELKTDSSPEGVQFQLDMLEAFTRENARQLEEAGFEATPENLHLAHFAGVGGAKKALQADPNASVADVLGEGVVRANPFLKGATVENLLARSRSLMGDVKTARPQAPRLDEQPPVSPGLPPAQDPSRNTPAADVQGAQQDQQARVAQLLQSLAAAQQQVESSGLPPAQDPRAGPFGGGSQGAPMPPAQGDFAPQQSPIPRQPIGPNSIPPAQDTRQRTEANLAGQGGPRISASLDSEQLQQSLREFLQSGDSSTIGQLPVGQRPNFLLSLGAAMRGQ